VTSNPNQKREPKGTSTGGQFASDINPESTVVLVDDSDHAIEFETGEFVILPGCSIDSIDSVYPPEGPDDTTVYRMAHFDDGLYEASQLRRPESQESRVKLDNEFVYELSPDGDPDQKSDRRFFNCDECGEVRFSEECEDCGAMTRSLSGQTARDIGLLDDEPNEEDEPQSVDGGVAIEQLIKNTRAHIDRILRIKELRVDAGGDTLDQLIDEGELIGVLREKIILLQQEMLESQRKELDELRKDANGFNLDRAIFENVCSSIEFQREGLLRVSSDDDVDPYEASQLTDLEIEQVRALVDEHLSDGISRDGDKALGYMIESESEYCLAQIAPRLAGILKGAQ